MVQNTTVELKNGVKINATWPKNSRNCCYL